MWSMQPLALRVLVLRAGTRPLSAIILLFLSASTCASAVVSAAASAAACACASASAGRDVHRGRAATSAPARRARAATDDTASRTEGFRDLQRPVVARAIIARASAAGRSASFVNTTGSSASSIYLCAVHHRHWSASAHSPAPPHSHLTMDWLSKLSGSAAPPAKAPAVSISLPSIPGISGISRSKLPNLHHPYVVIGAASVGTLLLLGTVSSALRSAPSTVIPSPVASKLPHLSEEEVQQLPYPPDALPGPRDVQSPYGTVRVYEWGPEEGDKILLIHGISTPGIALADLAHKLVRRGCRVMMFGRSPLSYRLTTPNLSSLPQYHSSSYHMDDYLEMIDVQSRAKDCHVEQSSFSSSLNTPHSQVKSQWIGHVMERTSSIILFQRGVEEEGIR
jgi:hypothetical protein